MTTLLFISGNQFSFLLNGLWVTIGVAAVTIILSLIFGIILGTLRYENIPIISDLLALLIDTIRNLPLLLIIFFTYFALPQIGIRLSIFWSAVTAMTIFESAMISEIIRAGLKGLPSGQKEAGYASGLNTWQVLTLILLPQAMRNMISAIVSQLIALIKDTSLATIIALPEIMHNAKIIYNQDVDVILQVFFISAVLYFIVCYSLSLVARRYEVKKPV